jgi:hypothetical protein
MASRVIKTASRVLSFFIIRLLLYERPIGSGWRERQKVDSDLSFETAKIAAFDKC